MRGLRRCSFDNQGDARASKSGTSDRRTPHAFCIYMNLIFKSAKFGSCKAIKFMKYENIMWH